VPRGSTGSRPGEQKAESRLGTAFLDGALADFSGDVARDERSDGPCCVLSAVDNRRDTRLLSDVLDHNPTHEDLRAFLGRLTSALAGRAVTLRGVSPLPALPGILSPCEKS
jgi:hypothetical protein